MNVKAAFLLPFMGPLPSYFPFWAKSCEANQAAFHWFVYSDQTEHRRSVNPAVTIVPYTYPEMIADFKRLLDIDIHDANPRMLCSYRLLFYHLRRHREPLDTYDFIGYTDMDMIYGDLAAHLPVRAGDYALISADPGHPCGPFTLMRADRVWPLSEDDTVRRAMTLREYDEFDESERFLQRVAGDQPVWCRADPLQPMLVPPFNRRKVFSVWNQGEVTLYDNRGHKKTAGFHHFSRYKHHRAFKVNADPQSDAAWAVCKHGVLPVRSGWTLLRLRLTLI